MAECRTAVESQAGGIRNRADIVRVYITDDTVLHTSSRGAVCDRRCTTKRC